MRHSNPCTVPAALVLTVALPAIATSACGDGPAAPSPALVASFATPVTGQLVSCATCGEGPAQWIAVEFPVTIANPSDRAGMLATLEARIVNRSRAGAELGRNLRPNAGHSYPDRHLPAGGRLTVDAGLVFFPVPPPRDHLAVEVTVTLTDGRSTRQVGALVVAVSASPGVSGPVSIPVRVRVGRSRSRS